VDLFLELMAALTTRGAARFVWLGGRPRSVARRLDAEVGVLGMDDDIVWRPRGAAPSGLGVVHVVTARSAAAARESLAEAAPGAPTFGVSSSPEVAEVLRAGGVLTVPYPDVTALAEQLLQAHAG
jgi:hypothetical protein